MKVTFEDAWHNRLPNSDDLDLLPEIEHATQADKQVAVHPPLTWLTRAARQEPPASLASLRLIERLCVSRIHASWPRRLVSGPGDLSARDALHVAIMQRNEIEEIMSFDHGFDTVPGIRRRPS